MGVAVTIATPIPAANDDPVGEVNLPKADCVCSGCRRTCDHAHSPRYRRTALRVRGNAWEDEESSAVRRSMQSAHLATGSTDFRPSGPISSQALRDSEINGLNSVKL